MTVKENGTEPTTEFNILEINISEIIVNERLRKEIKQEKVIELAESISKIGLINPITITSEKVLIAGLHRILAYKELGLTTIPSRIIDSTIKPDDIELIEIDENLIRADLHFIERGEHLLRRKDIYEDRYPESKQDERAKLLPRDEDGKFTENETISFSDSFSEDTANKTGLSKRTIQQEMQIARDISPEVKKFIKVQDIGKSDALLIAREELERQHQIVEKLSKKNINVKTAILQITREEKPKHTPALPKGVFDVILADPAWSYDWNISESRSLENHYQTMELEDICNLEIPSADNAVLFLWATTARLNFAFEVIEAWGFTYKTSMVWVKDKIGMGYYVRNQHEFVLIATKGSIGVPEPRNRPSSVFESPRTRHSEKPTIIHDLIEQMYPGGTYLELFARDARENWIVWGNEVE